MEETSQKTVVDRRIILKWIPMNRVGWSGLGLPASGWGQVVGFCERGDERLGSVKGRELLD
jgi:hypothetical protein